MSTPNIDGEYPGSQSAMLLPILQAVFADVQSRNVTLARFAPSMTKFPPVDTDPGEAYSLKIYDRFAHVVFSRWSPNAEVEVLFGTGGFQYGPKRVLGHMAFSSQWTDLLSLMTVYWITWQLSQMGLTQWNMQLLNQHYTSTIANPLYTNYLRTFCYTVLGIDENSFTSSTNNVGHATDYDDQ
jgi:hypothetical protein